MSIIKNLKRGAVGVVAAIAVMAAHADVIYSFTDTAVGAFGAGPYGTVTLHQAGADMEFTIALRSDMNFVNTGGGHSMFSFNALGVADTDVTNVKFNGVAVAGFSVIAPAGNPGYGTTFTLGIDCTSTEGSGANAVCRNGSPGQKDDPLTFTVANAAYSDFGFMASGTTAFFASDVICNGCATVNGSAPTGAIAVVGGPRPPQEVPEPGSLALLGVGLLAVGIARRRTRR